MPTLTTAQMTSITTHPRGAARVGVNRDGQPVGYAVRIRRTGEWTAFVYKTTAPFEFVCPNLPDRDTATMYIAEHGATPDHLAR